MHSDGLELCDKAQTVLATQRANAHLFACGVPTVWLAAAAVVLWCLTDRRGSPGPA
jgi:hypothetical protein